MNKFLFASMIMVGMSACSKDDVVSNGENGGIDGLEGAAYMSLSISMPSSNGSRANGGVEEGTDSEQTISNMSIYIWDRNNELIKLVDPTDNNLKPVIYDFVGSDLRPSEPNKPSAPDKSTVYTTQPIPVSKSDVYKIAVLVNNGRNVSKSDKRYLSANVTPDFLRKELTEKDIKTITGDKLFFMTNATTVLSHELNKTTLALDPIKTEVPAQDKWNFPDGKFLPDGTFGININGTKANPTAAIIPVERAVAKLEEVTTKLTHEILDNKKQKVGSVTFTDYALVNANTKFYPVKQLCLIPTDKQPVDTELEYDTQTDTDNKFYIVDPNFVSHKIEDFLYNKFEPTGEANITWNTLASRPSFYTLENTMIAKDQMNAYTTGFYYKAKFTLDTKDPADANSAHVYKFGTKLYSFNQLKNISGLIMDGLTDDSSIDEFYKKGITKYDNGVCYYPYWIRHIENSEKLAPMEFGVVRNNWYKMAVTKVNEIGFNKPVNPDPSTPDENPDTMLEVVVKVMPWTVRNNNIEF